jgi:DNA-binding NarL/FixJ family response regulator
MDAMRVLVADDHEIVRWGLCSLIEEQPGWEVAAEAADGREAVEKMREVRPDVAVMDLTMPSMNGLEATRQIVKDRPGTKVLVLTTHESDPLIRDVVDSGARGCVLKTGAGQDLVTALEALRRNKTFFTSRVAHRALEGYLRREFDSSEREARRHRLTPRQREILQLLAEGKCNKEVAVELGISVKTAETHRANIMRRLDCHSVTELVRYAIRNHIIEA